MPRKRIPPTTVLPAYLRVTVTCPLCSHRVPLDSFREKLDESESPHPEFWRLWPRKPDGGRGFHWERLDADALHRVELAALAGGRFEDVWHRTLGKVTVAMVAWLNRFGIDKNGNPVKVALISSQNDPAP